MTLVNLGKLVEAGRKHAAAKGQLDAWAAEVQREIWQKPDDVKRRYGTASFLAENVVIFNIKGNRYRLAVKVNYAAGIVLLKWFGTHAEYDKTKF